ncbi:hypothetical protein L9F63_027156, partial [Diploptera punctata]
EQGPAGPPGPPGAPGEAPLLPPELLFQQDLDRSKRSTNTDVFTTIFPSCDVFLTKYSPPPKLLAKNGDRGFPIERPEFWMLGNNETTSKETNLSDGSRCIFLNLSANC